VSADVLNPTNAGESLQEKDLSGPSFNLRLPVAIRPPQWARFRFRYEGVAADCWPNTISIRDL
jgi:hypothetical protein